MNSRSCDVLSAGRSAPWSGWRFAAEPQTYALSGSGGVANEGGAPERPSAVKAGGGAADGIPPICETQQVLLLLLPFSASSSSTAILGMTHASSQDASSVGIAARLLVPAIVFLTVGALAYSGLWRSWARWKPPVVSIYYFPYLPLGIGWTGVGLLLGAVALVLPPPAQMPVAFLVVAIVVLGLIGMGFMPRVLLPRWYRAAKGLDRRASDSSRGAAVSRDASAVRSTVAGSEQDAPSPKGTRDGVPLEEVMRKTFGSAD